MLRHHFEDVLEDALRAGHPAIEQGRRACQSLIETLDLSIHERARCLGIVELTGDVTLSARAGAATWANFFALMESVEVPDAFMTERPLNVSPVERNLFGDDA